MTGHIPPFEEWPAEVRRWFESLGKRSGDTLRANTGWILDPLLLGVEFEQLRHNGLSMNAATRKLADTYAKDTDHIRRVLRGLGLRGERLRSALGGDRDQP
jgi:hypothetical protein